MDVFRIWEKYIYDLLKKSKDLILTFLNSTLNEVVNIVIFNSMKFLGTTIVTSFFTTILLKKTVEMLNQTAIGISLSMVIIIIF